MTRVTSIVETKNARMDDPKDNNCGSSYTLYCLKQLGRDRGRKNVTRRPFGVRFLARIVNA